MAVGKSNSDLDSKVMFYIPKRFLSLRVGKIKGVGKKLNQFKEQ